MPVMVDLGLPSGTLWADRNVGADKPEDYGDYFRFGEIVPLTRKASRYIWDYIVDDIAGTDRDAAMALLGENFRMPTYEQIVELRDKCYREWAQLNGVNGFSVVGPNGKSIFLPAAGICYKTIGNLRKVASDGCYWSATPYDNSRFVKSMNFSSTGWWADITNRDFGVSIRPVAAERKQIIRDKTIIIQ